MIIAHAVLDNDLSKPLVVMINNTTVLIVEMGRHAATVGTSCSNSWDVMQ